MAPRKPKKIPKVLSGDGWVEIAPVVLALAKYFKGLIKEAEGPAREYIIKELDSLFPVVAEKGGLKIDADATGNSGTLSYRGPSRKAGTSLEVENALGLMLWCEEHGIDHGAQPSVVFPEEFIKNLEKLVEQNGGVLPDGVVDTTAYTKETLVVRMSEDQERHLLEKKGGMTLKDFYRLLTYDIDPKKK